MIVNMWQRSGGSILLKDRRDTLFCDLWPTDLENVVKVIDASQHGRFLKTPNHDAVQ